MSRAIYFVGKPYPKAYDLPAFRGGGYKLGILLDKNVTLKNREGYENVAEVDFSSENSVLEAGKSRKIDGLVCTYENYILAKSLLAEALNLPSQSVLSAKMCTDKLLMRQAFAQADPSITPRFGTADSLERALEIAKDLSYPLIIKPANLVKSLLVLKCADEADLRRNFAYAQSRIKPLYEKYKVYGRRPQLVIEEFITGRTCSIAAFVDSRGQPHFCEGIVALTNAQDIGSNDNYIYKRRLPADLDAGLTRKLFETAEKGIKALKMASVPAHVELIYNEEGVKLIEIGARIGGYRPRMYSTSYGIDMITQEIGLALGKTPDVSGRLKAYCAVYELFPEAEGKFAGIQGDIDQNDLDYYSVKANPGQAIGPAKNGYKAAAVIIVKAQDKSAFQAICSRVESLKVGIEK